MQSLKDGLQQLLECGYEKLVTPASEDMKKKKLMCSIMEKARNLKTVICGLNIQLTTQRADLCKALSGKDDDISLLKMQLATLMNNASEDNNTVISECAKEVCVVYFTKII